MLVLGTGGVSIFAAQLALAGGCKVIATSSSDEKLARAKTLGVHEGVNYRKHKEWNEEVKRLNGGRGVDHVIEGEFARQTTYSVARKLTCHSQSAERALSQEAFARHDQEATSGSLDT